ncbi:ring finger [Colletotrichum musicola]|uniref:Ring finger n=1 Tax=Colletotrichum musicola TaxID=2175873 RepID=A0A8H6NU22_9PEZI|nr:ring finger [Colletotrichum musicola]
MADNAERTKSECTAAVLDIFPDVCPDYLEQTAAKLGYNHDLVVDEIMRGIDEGEPYPKLPDQKILKRKRDAHGGDEASRARRKYDHADRHKETSSNYVQLSRKVLAQDFPRAAVKSIGKVFAEKDNLLFRTYVAIDKILRDKDLSASFEMKKTRTPTAAEYLPARLDQTILETKNPDAKRALEELRAARLFCQSEAAKSNAAAAKEREEEENFKRAEEDGTVAECGCCFGDFAMNRMVCCDNPSNEHNFCVQCARLNAENIIGLSKYQLVCMSTDGCNAGFSNSQRSLFLDDKLIAALDRIEAEDVLRMAGVENLETCPFCPFAAEYPPVEENKEFSCANPECLVVSCRLCKGETHIPKSCEEAVSENHSSARREIEEAMSAALIRKCNKCGTPFIKESGCNKMTCTRSGCGNVQCYVCAKSCDYAHFNDTSRGGKQGNCPLFDGSVNRHADDVNKAEERARKKIMDDNPDIDENLLKVDGSIKEQKGKNPAPNPAPVPRVAREPVMQRVILENAPLLQDLGNPFPYIPPPQPPAQGQPRRPQPYNGFAQPPAQNNQQRPRVGHPDDTKCQEARRHQTRP